MHKSNHIHLVFVDRKGATRHEFVRMPRRTIKTLVRPEYRLTNRDTTNTQQYVELKDVEVKT